MNKHVQLGILLEEAKKKGIIQKYEFARPPDGDVQDELQVHAANVAAAWEFFRKNGWEPKEAPNSNCSFIL